MIDSQFLIRIISIVTELLGSMIPPSSVSIFVL